MAEKPSIIAAKLYRTNDLWEDTLTLVVQKSEGTITDNWADIHAAFTTAKNELEEDHSTVRSVERIKLPSERL